MQHGIVSGIIRRIHATVDPYGRGSAHRAVSGHALPRSGGDSRGICVDEDHNTLQGRKIEREIIVADSGKYRPPTGDWRSVL